MAYAGASFCARMQMFAVRLINPERRRRAHDQACRNMVLIDLFVCGFLRSAQKTAYLKRKYRFAKDAMRQQRMSYK
jgi:hypothetical protein